MKTFTLTKEITIDDLPKEMHFQIAKDVIPNCTLYFSTDGTGIDIHHEAYDYGRESVTHSISNLVDELQNNPDTAKCLIPVLEIALEKLKNIVSKFSDDDGA
jgi:hypothetical protein